MASGNLYFPSDGHKIERSNGSTWDGWGPIYPLSDASLPSFSWQNQGTNTTATTYGGEEMTLPNVNAAWSISARYIAVPSTPWSITAGLLIQGGGNLFSASDFLMAGLVLSDGTKSRIFGTYSEFDTASAGVVVWYFSNSSTTVGDRASSVTQLDVHNVAGRIGGYPIFYKLYDDGTNWTWSVSANGIHFGRIFQEARNTDLTATRIGYGGGYDVGVAAGTWTSYVRLISWKQGTS